MTTNWRKYCNIKRICQFCGKEFLAYFGDIKRGYAKYCSLSCSRKANIVLFKLSYDLPSLKNWEWGYIAGFIDGEGYINLKDYNLIAISNTDKSSIDWLAEKLKCKYTEIRPKTDKRKILYTLRISRKMAILKILEKLLPYLIIKKEKAKLMITKLKKDLSSQSS